MNNQLQKQIIERVCKELGVKTFDLLSTKRHHHICDCRYMLMGIFKHGYGYTQQQVAEALERKDHTTVIHGLKQLKKYYQFDTIFREKFNYLNLCLFGHLDYLDVDFRGKEIGWRKAVQSKGEPGASDSYEAILRKYAVAERLSSIHMAEDIVKS